ncbi:MAG: methyltransferase [Crocinitomicaceae bacterium]|nr:methyltransferase [Crocinitomicaceae bacterium]
MMMAQKNPEADITAIEPDLASLKEAQLNFQNSVFADRLMAINASLQMFGAMEKYDLIVCNPPYFDGTYLSEDLDRNRARHNFDLRVDELYDYASELLSENGRLNVIIPYIEETEHIERAFDNDLFVQSILHTTREDGSFKRTLISFGMEDVDPIIDQLLVKDRNNKYSERYIEMTKDFYLKDLRS